MTRLQSTLAAAGCTLALGAFIAGAWVQPERRQIRESQPTEVPNEPPIPPEGFSPERIRAHLDEELRRVERDRESLTRRERNLRQALSRLDAGERPGAIMRDLFRQDRAEGEPRPRVEGGPDGGQPEDRPRRMGPEERERLVRFLESEFPDLAERLRGFEGRAPGDVERMYGRLAPRIAELQQLRETDPEMADIKVREFRSSLAIITTTREMRQALQATEEGSPERQRARRSLRAALADAFDARSDARALELRRLTERIAEIESELRARRENRDALIDHELERVETQAVSDSETPRRRRVEEPVPGGG